MSIRVRVLSDLHLERDLPDAIAGAQADLVVLAGDIHNHAEGLRWAAETFDAGTPVVYVPGNHEYYDGAFGALDTAMRDTARSLDNVHYLNGDVYASPDGRFRVLGTTLWTDFALFGDDAPALDDAMAACTRTMFDFNGVIQVEGATGGEPGPGESRALTPADTLALHRGARAWLEAELARPWAGQTIVATHHAPHRASLAERYANDIVSGGVVA